MASRDGHRVLVVNPDLDSVSVLRPSEQRIEREIPLGEQKPTVAKDGSFTPRVMPRSLALTEGGHRLFVTGQRSGRLYEVDVDTGTVRRSVLVGSEPIGVLAAGDALYVACSQDSTVVKVDAHSFAVTGRVSVDRKPWALALNPSGGQLLVTHLLGPGVTVVALAPFGNPRVVPFADIRPRKDRRLAHGVARGLYDLAVAADGTAWTVHQLLGPDTAQPALDFESTAFPALTHFRSDARTETFSTDARAVPGVDGAFADVVSGPHALQLTQDGRFVLMANAQSEDVLVFDTLSKVQSFLLRPLGGHQPEGLALSADERFVYLDLRNTVDVAVLQVERTEHTLRLRPVGKPLRRVEEDAMPPLLREGQHVFHSANSDELPVTQNHWMACVSCHIEGRSDAVTWKFTQGPRDTPSNAGGTLGTGFLQRTADRRSVVDYFEVIHSEQGGAFDLRDPVHHAALVALEAYVNRAIPLPIPPATDAKKVALGKQVFERADVGCAVCHFGPRLTDSGSGNPGLALDATVLLHDVGTCVSPRGGGSAYADAKHLAFSGPVRQACLFDTPSLNGLADSAPYLHDGSAPTIEAVLEQTAGQMGDVTPLQAPEREALVEYLRSL